MSGVLSCSDDTGARKDDPSVAANVAKPTPETPGGSDLVDASDRVQVGNTERDAGFDAAAASDAASRPEPSDAAVRSDDDAGDEPVVDAGDAAQAPQRPQEPQQPDDDDAGEPPNVDAGQAQAPMTGPDGCPIFQLPSDCKIPEGRGLPVELRCTGLYGDWAERRVACGVTEYKPAYELYSDGAAKRRWYQLPEGTHVDATRPEAFKFPIGTQFWKEFRVEVDGESRLAETRLLKKIAEGKTGWLYTSYVWDAAAANATQTNYGAQDVNGSDHVVPSLEQCRQCHVGREDFILGWDPIMLGPGATGVDLSQLVAAGTLQNIGGTPPTIPGTDSESLGLAYLHANCGISCHNPEGDARDSGLFMRLDTDKLANITTTPTLATGLFKTPWENAKIGTLTPPADSPFFDLVPLRPDASLVLVRMQVRGTEAQMPPLGTLHIDEDGVALVQALIGGN
ncbi:MAG: hypothetical protein ABW321_03115 [Polyangiales bacterium]